MRNSGVNFHKKIAFFVEILTNTAGDYFYLPHSVDS